MMAGIIGIPAMIAVGVPQTTAAGTILMGIAAGLPFELPVWQFFSTALELPIDTVKSFMMRLFPFAAFFAVLFALVETRRKGVEHAWSLASAAERSGGDSPKSPGSGAGAAPCGWATPPGTRCSPPPYRWFSRSASNCRSSRPCSRACSAPW